LPIPESPHQGATKTAQATHESIRSALTTASGSLVKDKDITMYLQGSYKNSTNIRGDSDVDLVVLLNSTFLYDTSGLTADERKRAELRGGHYSP
jgi:tRNA nucleotidyltransferase (CCA-adding enzyme)